MRNELAGVNFDQNAFEMLDYGRPLYMTNTPMDTFIGQLKQPMQRVDGRWSQVFLLMDGSVQQAVSDTPDFSAWQQTFQQQVAADAAERASAKAVGR